MMYVNTFMNKYYNDKHAHTPRKKSSQNLANDYNLSDDSCSSTLNKKSTKTLLARYSRGENENRQSSANSSLIGFKRSVNSSSSRERYKAGSVNSSSSRERYKAGSVNSSSSRERYKAGSVDSSSSRERYKAGSVTSSYGSRRNGVSVASSYRELNTPLRTTSANTRWCLGSANRNKLFQDQSTSIKSYADQHSTTASRFREISPRNDSKLTILKPKTTPEDDLIDAGINTEQCKEGVIARRKSARSAPIPPTLKKVAIVDSKENGLVTRMNWNDYQRLGVIHEWMDELEVKHPAICTINNIGLSVQGRDLKMIHISNSNASNYAVWLDAGIHAREWIAPAVATYVINHIANNFDRLSPCMKNKDWYILPVMNPDGYEHSHTCQRMWRKNRATDIYGKVVGVDLNRNFSYGWGFARGSSKDPGNELYCGPHAFSEPESCAVRDFLKFSETKFAVYITLHCYGQNIMFPFSCKDELCPDYVRLLEGATEMSKAIYKASGCIYKVGISRDLMVGAAGTSNDWSYSVANIPFCYLIELRSKEHKFLLPKEEIEQTGDEIVNSLMALMKYIDSTPVNIWKEEPSTMDIMVEGPKAATVAGLLHEKDIPFAVAIGDVEFMIEREKSIHSMDLGNSCACFGKRNFQIRTNVCKGMDWKSYHRLDVIYAFLDNLASEFPSLCSVRVIGKSAEGRDLKLLKISNGNPANEGVWLDGAIHAREWVSPAAVTYMADNIVRKWNSHPESVTSKDWYILPLLNPDGYVYTHTHDRMWRKNRRRYGECVGVDLNRNFSKGWGEMGEEGSSEDPGSIFFRGSEPFSEPETAAVRDTITGSPTKFKVFLSCHSYGEVVIFPWGYTADPCPDYVDLLQGGSAMAKAMHKVDGHTYKVGSTKDLMYYSAGTSVDWSYGVAKIPYSYMLELRDKKHRFLLPKEQIITTAKEVYCGVLQLLHYVDNNEDQLSKSGKCEYIT